MRTLVAILSILIWATNAYAQVGTCEPAEAEAMLDINNVRARILNNGALFWKGSPHVYEVPRLSGRQAIFASSLWIGGQVNGELKFAGSTYGPWEYWPGPLDDQGNPPADCKPFDKIYEISIQEIIDYENTGSISENLAQWPWELGAPVIDGDSNLNNYNLSGGDRPEVHGHQTLWWIMNDRGNVHERTGSAPMGMEIQVSAFAAASNEPHISNTTFYKYKLVYKGDTPIDSTYIGLMADVDLGNFDDDYIGSDSTLSLGYTYNADNFDEGGEGYGEAPPAVGYTVLQGPVADSDGRDNDRDNQIDEDGERLPMTSLIFYNGGGGDTGDPQDDNDMYKFMQGRWKDGQPFTEGGNARDFSATPTSFVFSGDPDTGEGWTELNPASDGSMPPRDAADRRFLISTGPFSMMPGDEEEITFAVVWARGENHLASVTALKEATASVRASYDAGFNIAIPEPGFLPTVALASPATGAAQQPLNPSFFWQAVDSLAFYQIQIANTPLFTEPDSLNPNITLLEGGSGSPFFRLTHPILAPNTVYYWRVRQLKNGIQGPWSDAWFFSTSETFLFNESGNSLAFMAVQNAAGPIVPPDMAAFAFNISGFPTLEGRITPEGSYPALDRPTRGVQQSTSDAAWGIHAGGSDVADFANADTNNFVSLVLNQNSRPDFRDNYEWRFPQHCLDRSDGVIEQGDCLALRAFDDSVAIEVPFELWNIGKEDNAMDDFRMIPFICEEACDAGTESNVFDIGGDHLVSGGTNDPFTDWVYWMNPADNGASPGEEGYTSFFFEQAPSGKEVFSRMALILWNGGTEPPYEAEYPEPGTIYRIKTDIPWSPPLSAPADQQVLTTKTASFFWQGNAGSYQLQVDTTPAFDSPIINLAGLTDPFFETDALEDNNQYYWRIRLASPKGFVLSDWSETWSFTIPLNVRSETPTNPITFELAQNYPNPFNTSTTIRYAVPSASDVRLEIYDILGRRVQLLVNQHHPPGWHETIFDASALSNGTYFYRLTAGSFIDSKSMVLLK